MYVCMYIYIYAPPLRGRHRRLDAAQERQHRTVPASSRAGMYAIVLYTHSYGMQLLIFGLPEEPDDVPSTLWGSQCLRLSQTRQGWPSHDIAITNIVWCMAYKRGVGGGHRIWCNRRAVVLQ